MASGTLAEMKIATSLMAHGLLVSRPLDPDGPYDLVVDVGSTRLLRVQCKTSRQVGGCLGFNCHSTDHGQGPRDYRGRADLFGVWFPPNDQVYVVPVPEAATRMTSLRLVPTRNNQAEGVRWAADHTVERWVASLGVIEREEAA